MLCVQKVSSEITCFYTQSPTKHLKGNNSDLRPLLTPDEEVAARSALQPSQPFCLAEDSREAPLHLQPPLADSPCFTEGCALFPQEHTEWERKAQALHLHAEIWPWMKEELFFPV